MSVEIELQISMSAQVNYEDAVKKYGEEFAEAVRLLVATPEYLRDKFPGISDFLKDKFPKIKSL